MTPRKKFWWSWRWWSVKSVGIKASREDKANVTALRHCGNAFFWLYYTHSVNDNFETLGWFCNWRFQYCHNLINLSRDSGVFNLMEVKLSKAWPLKYYLSIHLHSRWLTFVLSVWSVNGHRLPTGRILARGLARVIALVWARFILEGR